MPASRRVVSVATYAGFALAALLVAALVLWIVPGWLTTADDLTEAERLKAANDTRAPLVALLVAFGAGGTLLYTARTYRLNMDGHVTDRYSKAVDQLDSARTPVRIGGVYALERIGVDSPRDRETILQVLGAFVCERSRDFPAQAGEPNGDVKAALSAARTLLALTPDAVLDLRGASLDDLALQGIPTSQVDRGSATTGNVQDHGSSRDLGVRQGQVGQLPREPDQA